MRKSSAFVVLLLLILSSCSSDQVKSKISKEPKNEKPSAEIQFGDIVFSDENLKVKVFLNGEPIQQAQSSKEWKDAATKKEAAWCYSDKKNANGEYEVLYNYFALTDPRGLAKKSALLDQNDIRELDDQMDENVKIRRFFKSEFSGERNYAGKFFDLDVVNWWILSNATEDSTKASVCCWSPSEERCYISNVSKGNGFLVRCIKN